MAVKDKKLRQRRSKQVQGRQARSLLYRFVRGLGRTARLLTKGPASIFGGTGKSLPGAARQVGEGARPPGARRKGSPTAESVRDQSAKGSPMEAEDVVVAADVGASLPAAGGSDGEIGSEQAIEALAEESKEDVAEESEEDVAEESEEDVAEESEEDVAEESEEEESEEDVAEQSMDDAGADVLAGLSADMDSSVASDVEAAMKVAEAGGDEEANEEATEDVAE
jgi:hypothetical protein